MRTEIEEQENLMTDDFDSLETSEYKVVYVQFVGKDADDLNIYQFLLSSNEEDIFAEGWGEKPASNVSNSILLIDADQYQYKKELKTELILDSAQDNTCFSMQDCRDNIVALAYENIDEYEEYPDDGRIVIHFGEPIDEVEKKFAKRDMYLKFV